MMGVGRSICDRGPQSYMGPQGLIFRFATDNMWRCITAGPRMASKSTVELENVRSDPPKVVDFRVFRFNATEKLSALGQPPSRSPKLLEYIDGTQNPIFRFFKPGFPTQNFSLQKVCATRMEDVRSLSRGRGVYSQLPNAPYYHREVVLPVRNS